MSKIILILVLLNSYIFSKNITSTGEFLLISPYANLCGYSGSFPSLANDISIVFSNPAGAGNIYNYELSFSQTLWLVDLNLSNLSFLIPIKKIGTFGGSFSFLWMADKLEEIGIDGLPSGANIRFNNLAGTVFYASPPFWQKTYGGISLKYAFVQIYNKQFSAFGFDIGLYKNINDFSIGLALQNIELGSSLLPAKLTSGISYKYKIGSKISLIPAIGVDFLKFSELYYNFALEMQLTLDKISFSLRLGYRLPNLADILSGLGISTGIILFNNYKIDWGFIPSRELGFVHKFTLNLIFGRPTKHETEDLEPVYSQAQEEEYFELASDYMEKGDYMMALNYYEKIIKINPSNLMASYNIACIYAKTGNTDDAIRWLKKCIQIDPSIIEMINIDEDLELIREMEEYKEIIKDLESK